MNIMTEQRLLSLNEQRGSWTHTDKRDVSFTLESAVELLRQSQKVCPEMRCGVDEICERCTALTASTQAFLSSYDAKGKL